jgi:5-methyltetrahydropteroyltriglutamate--homocysteine methyltransferase
MQGVIAQFADAEATTGRTMQRSTSKKILTTHVGSLPRPNGTDRPGGENDAALREMVAGVVARQRETGIDVINEGEYTKGGDWLSYVDDRFGGFEARPPAGGKPIILQGMDREVFADFYRSATERGTLFYEPAGQIKQSRPHWVASGPISYRGEAGLRREIDIFRSVIGPDTEAFITTTAPASLEPYHGNEYYKSQDEFVFALAEAMRSEYQAIVTAGFILQVDDAWLPALWDRIGIDMGLPRFANTARCGSRRSIMRSAACRRTASAIICAGAAGTAPTPSTSNSTSWST